MIPGILFAHRSGAGQAQSSPVDRWGTSDISPISPTPVDGGLVQTVTNGKTGGVDATQATEANRPVYDSSSVPGLPLIRFSTSTSLTVALTDPIQFGLIQIDTSQLSDGDVILSRPTSEGGTSKAAFELRIVEE